MSHGRSIKATDEVALLQVTHTAQEPKATAANRCRENDQAGCQKVKQSQFEHLHMTLPIPLSVWLPGV